MKSVFLYALTLTAFINSGHAQTTVYVPEGWLYNFDYTGTAQGLTVNGGTTIDPAAAGTVFGILDRSASPQGGEFVAGVYQGTRNWQNYFYAGIPFDSLITASGLPATLTDATSYTANFWMRGNELNDLIAGHKGFMFDSTVAVTVTDAGATDIQNYNATISFLPDDWTEVAIPFTWDSATMTGGTISPLFLRTSTDWNYDTNTTAAAAIFSNRNGATGFDFIVSVPEPSSSFLFAMAATAGLLSRSRRSRG